MFNDEVINMPVDIQSILYKARELGASDIHIQPDKPMHIRIEGIMIPTNRVFNGHNINRFLGDLHMSDLAYGRLMDELRTDFTYADQVMGRFRVNVSKLDTSNSLSIRPIDMVVRTPQELGFRKDLIDCVSCVKNGLVIVTGTTSSGKSTSLDSFLTFLTGRGKHIITLSDPVENILDIKGSFVTQMEYGRDFKSFSDGISTCMRKDPDIISLSEMRDAATIKAGLQAAETGHLVFATCHTQSVEETKSRILSVFSGEDLRLISSLLESTLRVLISQELVYNEKLGKRELVYAYEEF